MNIQTCRQGFVRCLTHPRPSCHADDYRGHTSCITEVERYEKRAPKKNGKVPPQQMWMDLIAEAVDTAPGHLKHHVHAMSSLDNVPRKEKAFRNFTSNSLNLRGKSGEATVSEIWVFLCDLREAQKQQTAIVSRDDSGASNQQTEKESVVDSPANVEVVSSVDDHDSGEAIGQKNTGDKTTSETAISKKTVQKAMKRALKKASERALTVKALRKVVHNKLVCDKILLKKLVEQNLKSSDKFVVDGKRVTLKVD